MFTLTRRMFVESRAVNLFNTHVTDYYDYNDAYDGDESRIDDLIFTSEMEWDSLFGVDTKEVIYNL